jgi:ABC-type nitrate/sulfonate/bicarbonate transport system permease component
VATAIKRVALFLALPAVLLAVWWFGSAGSTKYQAPSLEKIFAAFGDQWFKSAALKEDVLSSLLRLAEGYALALVLGIGLGVVIGSVRWLRSTLEPVLEFLRAIPPPVLVPVIVLFAGIGDTMKVLVILAGCIWPILLNTVEGVRGADEVLVDTGRSYRITGWMRLRKLVLPGAAPQIFTGARQSLAIAIILMVISEMFYADSGMGHTIVDAGREFNYSKVWSGVLLLGLLGVLLSLLFWLVESRALRWYHGFRAAERGTR